MPGEQVLGPPHQQRVRARLINGYVRRPEPHHRHIDVMQRTRRIARRFFNREPRHAGLARQPNAFRDFYGSAANPRLKSGRAPRCVSSR